MSDVTDPPRAEDSAEPTATPSAEAEPEPPATPSADAEPSAAAQGPAEPAAESAEPSAAAPSALAPAPKAPTQEELEALQRRPSFVFFGVLAAVALVSDIGSKAWAEVALSKRTAFEPSITLIKDHLAFTLAYNRGGAWGLLHDANESIRRPFFLLVSVLAIAFIVSLYSRLAPTQRALKWGLPLVLGGALGNLSDRITRSSVVDFIDYHALWIEKMNAFIAKYAKGWTVTDHWPTFNVADIFICVGVGLMAVDMVTSRRKPAASSNAPPGAPPPAPPEEPKAAAPPAPEAPAAAPPGS